eukprot:CAMPEP_0117419486 /NCGR_PEP_ID=MMETSP0758-20121206/1030_1 /TAXON_ID=63605 /ORGANISM="Percolomonas cosmopolitus, Strain AE-1 (ATCC 50343)" /LENGTH=291 /DNA_ID=CAMNT_0005200563 /DNA_START=687 /DNA_END=1559 /DNA_ORIENTATION=+
MSTFVKSIIKKGELWTDPDFPPNDTSLYKGYDGQRYAEKIEWRRVSDIFKGQSYRMFYEGIEADDIRQGALGDCYFLSAIAAVANRRPESIQKLFLTQEVNNIYEVAFCKGGRWQRVVVDDYIPTYSWGTHPCFSQNHDLEIWVMILEKAYAKLHGSYLRLKTGSAESAFEDLTGYPIREFMFDSAKVSKELETTAFWDRMVRYFKSNYLMCVLTGDASEVSWSEKETGLITGHYYTLLDAKYKHGKRLLKLRNPWGQTEWLGDWSDYSSCWNDQLKQSFDWTAVDDGDFW